LKSGFLGSLKSTEIFSGSASENILLSKDGKETKAKISPLFGSRATAATLSPLTSFSLFSSNSLIFFL